MNVIGKFGIGGFASGLAQGFATGRGLKIKEADAKAREELFELEKPQFELQAGLARRRAALMGINVDGQNVPAKGASATAGAPGSAVDPKDSQTAAEHLRTLGDEAVKANLIDDAVKYYSAASQVGKLSFDNDLNKAMREALATNSPKPLADFFNEQMPGHSATFEQGKDGSYKVSFWNPDKSLAGSQTFKDLGGVISYAMQMASPQMYTTIQAGKLRARLAVLKANAEATRAEAAQTNAAAATRRAAAAERDAAANERRATASEERAQTAAEGGGKNLTDAAKWNRDLRLGRITPAQYAEHMQLGKDKRTHQLISEAVSRYRAEFPQGAQMITLDAKMPPTLDKYIADYVAERTGTKPQKARSAIPDAKNPAAPLSGQEFNDLPVGASYIDPGDLQVRTKLSAQRSTVGDVPLGDMRSGKAVFSGQPLASQVSSGRIGGGGSTPSRGRAAAAPRSSRSIEKPVPLPKSESELRTDGTVYQTVYGPATWDGHLFHRVTE